MNEVIVVVDDEEILVRHIARFLRDRKYQVFTAYSAIQAAQVIQDVYPDVVLMDLCLPDGDGGELISKIREGFPDTRFVVVTANGSIRSAVDNTKQGVFDYLTKPVEPDDLLHTVEQAINAKKHEAEIKWLRDEHTDRVTGADFDRINLYTSGATRKLVSKIYSVLTASPRMAWSLRKCGAVKGRPHHTPWRYVCHQHPIQMTSS